VWQEEGCPLNSVRVIRGGERERGKEAVGLRIEME